MHALEVRLPNGVLRATPSTDPAYPGIDVEFIADNENTNDLSRPRVLIEQSEDTPLRALIWNNPRSEDYSEEIKLLLK